MAIVDVDAHHGNGAQEIFWERGDVFTASVHVDPATGWFPHFLGAAAERGAAPGAGANLNLPLPPGHGRRRLAASGRRAGPGGAQPRRRSARRRARRRCCRRRSREPAAGDARTATARPGGSSAAQGLPTVVVQEGGYDLAAIGGLVLAALEGLEDGREGACLSRLRCGSGPRSTAACRLRRAVDGSPPPHWRLDAIAATERPRSPRSSADGRSLVFIHDRDTSDIWLLDLERARARAADDRQGSAAVLGGHDARLVARRRRPSRTSTRMRLARPGRGRAARHARRGREPGVARRRPARRHGRTGRSSRLAVVSVGEAWPQPLVRASPGDSTRTATRRGGGLARRADRRLRLLPRADLNRSEIRVVDVASGEPRGPHRARRRSRDGEPAWSPDGATLAFRRERGGWCELHLVDGRRARSASSPPARPTSRSPRGAATATSIAATVGRRDSTTSSRSTRQGRVDRGREPAARCGAPSWARDGSLVATYEDRRPRPSCGVVVPVGRVAVFSRRRPPPSRGAVRAPRGGDVSRPSTASRSRRCCSGRPGRRRAAGRPPSSTPTAGRLSATATSGTAMRSTSSTRATPGSRSTSAARRAAAATIERMNYGDWGVRGHASDCLAAADFLRTLDWVDGERLAIFGASYGSYMALCAVVEDAGERFRSAVCKYGDCDLLTTWAQGDRDGVRYCEGEHARASVREPRRLSRGLADPPARARRGAAAGCARRARRAGPSQAVRRARRGAAPPREDLRVRHLPDRRRTASSAPGRRSTSTGGSSGSSTGICCERDVAPARPPVRSRP